MHEHKECKHELKYCKQCDKVYCEGCKKEWGEKELVYYSGTTWTYPAITYGTSYSTPSDSTAKEILCTHTN